MFFARKTLAAMLASTMMLAMSGQVFAASGGSAVVSTSLTSGYTGVDCGQPVKIDVVMDPNTVLDALNVPRPCVSASLRLTYTTDSLTFVGLEGGLLNTVLTYTPEYSTANPCEVYRIVKAANMSNAALTGTLFKAVFTLKANGYKPYAVSLSDDLTTLTPLMARHSSTSAEFDMFNSYDNSATAAIGAGTTVGTSCGFSTIATAITPLTGPCGGQFDMPLAVITNTSNQIPVSFAFKVIYDTTQVQFDSVANGDLGTVYYGPQTVISGTQVYRVFSALGPQPGPPTNPTPVLATLRFTQQGVFPFTIDAQDETSGDPLVASDTFKSMYHQFDVTATTGVAGVPCTSVADWTLFDTPGSF